MRLVKFQHTIFAMPFALMAFAYAMWKYALAEVCPVPLWWCVPLVQVVLCMVFARNTAMGFNRWADRRIDAANPRTAGREIPAGVISPRRALTFVAVNALLFVACAATINRLTALLSPVALAVIMGYSYCKRFTWAAHLVLGLSLSIAPVGAYIALTGRFDWEPCVLALLVLNRGREFPRDRLVGIISHVAALKERIDKQVVVKKARSGGSTVEVIV